MLPLIGVEGVTKVSASVGAEQEYFLVDDKYYQERMDLKLLVELYLELWHQKDKN